MNKLQQTITVKETNFGFGARDDWQRLHGFTVEQCIEFEKGIVDYAKEKEESK